MNFPPIPGDFGQLSQWLIMPGTLALLAWLVINDFFKNADVDAKNAIKFGTFIVIGLISFALTKLSPDFVASIEPLWEILAAVIAAYYAPSAIRVVALLGIRLAAGRDAAHAQYAVWSKHGG